MGGLTTGTVLNNPESMLTLGACQELFSGSGWRRLAEPCPIVLDAFGRMPYLSCMRKQRKSAASQLGAALAALRMVKMTPERRSEVAKIAALARWKKKAVPAEEPEAVSA